MGLSINEAMKLAGDRNGWKSTVLNLGCQCTETSSHRRGIKSSQTYKQTLKDIIHIPKYCLIRKLHVSYA